MWRIHWAPLLFFIASACSAESFQAVGQRINFTNPAGYCTLGTSPAERLLWQRTEQTIGKNNRLVHAAARCSELVDLREGRADHLKHWLLIQLIGLKGEFKRLEISREAFLDGISTAVPRLDQAELNRRLSAAAPAARFDETEYVQIGRDGNALYASVRMVVTASGQRSHVTGLQAMTLLNALPLTVNVYESTGLQGSRDQLRPTLQHMLKSLLAEN